MTKDVLERIFDPFFTTKFTGRGLGLAAVLGIMKGHHGGIRIRSREGVGTDFEIVFPLANAPVRANHQRPAEEPSIDGKGKTALIIDDEPSIVEFLTDLLTEARFTVLTALDPVEGIEIYRREQERISFIVLDYSMPTMDGRAAFNALVGINSAAKIVLCSGYTEEEIKSAFGDVRPHTFIKKPYRPAEFLERVRGLL